jgi:hypothetical protein
MALVLVEGFDGYSTANEIVVDELYRVHPLSNINDDYTYTVAGRYGGKAISVRSSLSVGHFWLIPPGKEVNQRWTLGFNYRNGGGTAVTYPFIRLSQAGTEGAGTPVNLSVTANFALVVAGTTGNLVSTANDIVTASDWHHVELQAYCHTTNGTIELRVDGATVATVNDVNTGGSSSNMNYSEVLIASPGHVTYAAIIDDVYVCDGSGNTNNSFLGPCRVTTLFPTSDAGPNQGTPSTGNDHYALIDEVQVDTSSTYITVLDGDQELFGYADLTTEGAVKGVCLTTLSAPIGANGNKLKSLLKSGNSTSNYAAKYIRGGGVYSAVQQISETNPDTSNAWTPSEIDSGSFGFELDI